MTFALRQVYAGDTERCHCIWSGSLRKDEEMLAHQEMDISLISLKYGASGGKSEKRKRKN